MIGGIDTDREAIHGLARPRKLVELRHQLRHTLPELRSLRLRDAGVPDEAPQLPVTAHQSRLGKHLDVVGDRALRPLKRDRELAHGGRPLVEQAQDRRAEGMADRLDLGGPGERMAVDDPSVTGREQQHQRDNG
jgi:hypothetical protein